MISISRTPRAAALFAATSAIALLAVAGNAHANQTIDGTTVTVPGTHPSPWVVDNGLFLGTSGAGTLDVNSGGVVNVTNCAAIFMGQNAGSSGTLLIHDPGSVFNNAACGIQVGNSGTGAVTISNGGELDTLGSSFIGGGAGTSSSVTVTGTGSKWVFSGLLVGTVGNGTVNVTSGGLVTQSGCSTVTVGSGFNSVSAVNVGGSGSHWANGGCGFDLGTDGNGSLNVTGGAVVDGVGSLILGKDFNTSKGAITVSGVGSKLTSNADVEVGEAGVGTLTISGGAVLADASANLADLNGSSGSATVDGAGSAWNTSGALGVGRNGAGTLSITNGAVVTSASGWVSGSADGGSLTVSGSGSKWTATSSLDLGERGTSTISIINGGVVADQTGTSADLTGAAPTITIDGAGSAWTNSSTLSLGGGFNSTLALSVTNGGLLSDTQGTLGQGSVLVSGTNSAWTNTSTLRVGATGPGVLTIAHQGTVDAPGGVILGQSSSSSGVLNIGGAVGKPADSPGVLNAPTIVLGTGNGSQGTLNFNHNSVSYLFTPVISGPGKVNIVSGLTIFNADETYTGPTTISPGAILQIGSGPAAGSIVSDVADDGTLYFIRGGSFTYGGKVTGAGALTMFSAGAVLTLTGASTYTGATHVDAGGLIVNGSLGATTVSVGSTASLGGSGSIGGAVNVANSGILNGVAGQTLTMGDLNLSSGSVINANLGAPSATRLFNVNGNLVLDGTLNIANAGAFGPGLYRLIDYSGSLTDNTLALGTLPSGVQGSSLQVQTSGAHQVNLVFAGSAVSTPMWNGATTAADGSVHGGPGTWKLGSTNWTDANGANAGAWDGTDAIFAGAAGGSVSIDNSAGQITAQTLQFARDGYTISGGTLNLSGPFTPTIRVGDGTAAGANYTATISSVITGSSFLKSDKGTLILTADNTYGGDTLAYGGVLSISKDSNLGLNGRLRFANGGVVLVTSSFATNRIIQMAAAGELRIASGVALTLSGQFQESGSLIKSGAGDLIITGSNGYDGAVTVSAGKLQMDGDWSGATVAVQSGGVLSGGGTIGGAVTVANGGVLKGVTGETLTTGALTLNP
ncbi:MAG: autotransporter-associated beta strand repeat-containing protein, partial [Proteobacteria bacterium]|nr:autotransporter-associated beta strand repeat-containing protein [Pseudomonadota bacterium]